MTTARRRQRHSSALPAFWIVALFGLLFLTFCTPRNPIPSVYDTRGVRVGEVHPLDDQYEILDASGTMAGILSGSQLVSGSGSRLGEMIVSGTGAVSVLDARGKEMATIQQGTDCYDNNDKLLGRVNAQTDPSAAGAACLLLLLDRP